MGSTLSASQLQQNAPCSLLAGDVTCCSPGIPGRWKKRFPELIWTQTSLLQVTGTKIEGINCGFDACFWKQHFATKILSSASLALLAWALHRRGIEAEGGRTSQEGWDKSSAPQLCTGAVNSQWICTLGKATSGSSSDVRASRIC